MLGINATVESQRADFKLHGQEKVHSANAGGTLLNSTGPRISAPKTGTGTVSGVNIECTHGFS